MTDEQLNFYKHGYVPPSTKAKIVRIIEREGIWTYEGITNSPTRRTGQHADDKEYWSLGPIVVCWATRMTREQIERYEAGEIRANRYLWNERGNPDWVARRGWVLRRRGLLLRGAVPDWLESGGVLGWLGRSRLFGWVRFWRLWGCGLGVGLVGGEFLRVIA